MNQLLSLKEELSRRSDPERAKAALRYFKTGPGEYGEGDIFEGLTVPDIRKVAKRFSGLPLDQTVQLLHSPIHEERLCAVIILIDAYEKGNLVARRRIFRCYLDNYRYINNWDLVDISAGRIVGRQLMDSHDSGAILVRLAKSRDLWRRRIAIMATSCFINNGRHIPTFNIARLLLNDEHDLIHKAVGWMLREVGKRIDRDLEEEFLRKHYHQMPRTMLRYAIERFPKRLQAAYLAGRI